MARVRGVFERDEGSGIWWIRYFADGKRHREKVGRKSDAIRLYLELVDDALQFVSDHKSIRTYRSRGWIIKRELGARLAESITPQELDGWLKSHTWSPAHTSAVVDRLVHD